MDIEHLLDSILSKPSEVLFLLGAGISAPKPTCIPTVYSFYETLMNVCEMSSEEITYMRTQMLTLNPSPRFETFIYEFKKIDKEGGLYEIFNIQTYNTLHYFISCQINKGARGITTNFDECIENSGLSYEKVISYDGKDLDTLQTDSFLLKPHGTISQNRNNIVISDEQLSKTNNGFQKLPQWKNMLHSYIESRNVIVLGYSGSDDFDITPLLGNSSPKQIIWVNYKNSNLEIGKTSDLKDKIKEMTKSKHIIVINGDFQKYAEQKYSLRKGLPFKVDIEKLLLTIVNDQQKKQKMRRLILRHFFCYEHLFSVTNKELMLNRYDEEIITQHMFATFKLSRYQDCIDFYGKYFTNDLSLNSVYELTYYYLQSLIFLGKYKTALEIILTFSIENIEDNRFKCKWVSLIGVAFFVNKNYKKSKEYYMTAKKFSEQCNYLRGMMKSSWGIADILAGAEKKFEEALALYSSTLELAKSLGESINCTTICRNIAEVYIDLNKVENANAYLVKAKEYLIQSKQDYNEFYLLFTSLKIYFLYNDKQLFYKECRRLLFFTDNDVLTSLLPDLICLLVISHIEKNFSLKKMGYEAFLRIANNEIGEKEFRKIIGKSNMAIIMTPREKIDEKKYSKFRALIFKAST